MMAGNKACRMRAIFTCSGLLVALLALIAGAPAVNPGAARAEDIDKPARGMFLVAGREMQDPRFREAVILLLSADRTGATGLVINKSTDAKISDLVPTMRSAERSKNRVYFGGPVGAGQLLMLLRTNNTIAAAVPVLRDVAVSSDREVLLDAIRRMRAGDEYRVFAGYAGWAAGQLEWELERGQWRLVAASAEMVFHEREEKVWPALIRKSEEIMVRKQERERYAESTRCTSPHERPVLPSEPAFFCFVLT